MSKHFTEWMNEGRSDVDRLVTKRLMLADGSSLSIQASDGHYCAPRCHFSDYSEYYEFEIGFPSCKMDEIEPHQDGEGDPTQSVFGYVPKEVIEALIEARGGVQDFDNRG